MRLSGVSSETDLSDTALRTTRTRASWLLVNLGTAILASMVIALFDATIEQIVALASEIHRIVKNERRQKSGAEGLYSATVCTACSKLPEPGHRLLQCGRCNSVSYCGQACQKAHWKTHKKACALRVQAEQECIADGLDTSESAQKEVMRWFQGVPNLSVDCAARDDSGSNARPHSRSPDSCHLLNTFPRGRRSRMEASG